MYIFWQIKEELRRNRWWALSDGPTEKEQRTHSLLHVVSRDARLHFAKIYPGEGAAFVNVRLHDIGEEGQATHSANARRILYVARGSFANPLLRDSNLSCGNYTATSYMVGAISTLASVTTLEIVDSCGAHTIASLSDTPSWIICVSSARV
ncbi:unnamed protein product [Prorocentrum cordatum]|uniref:Uncharacterized protein n=1 Tax=Prorocentrum cordatum TaxID=2364126 RepID=A0ABN9PDX2_9DINO|nr:unnamed protein product [Polarella glacialis]